jgi:hypothetical protein
MFVSFLSPFRVALLFSGTTFPLCIKRQRLLYTVILLSRLPFWAMGLVKWRSSWKENGHKMNNRWRIMGQGRYFFFLSYYSLSLWEMYRKELTPNWNNLQARGLSFV